MTNRKALPEHLYNAYEWIDSADEWSEAVAGPSGYAAEAMANARREGDLGISEVDLLEVIDWYVTK